MQFNSAIIEYGEHVQQYVKTACGYAVVLLGRAHINNIDVIIGIVKPTGRREWLTTWNLDGSCAVRGILLPFRVEVL